MLESHLVTVNARIAEGKNDYMAVKMKVLILKPLLRTLRP